jgi:hypothetical protein
MRMLQSGGYYHVQRGPWWVMCCVLAAISFTATSSVPMPALRFMFSVVGGGLLLLGISIGHLVVENEGDQLFVHFGPFPLFRRRIRYDDIGEVEKGRLPFHESAGIHWTPWKGWIWSVRGGDCVILRLKRGTFRVGTDDADGLAGFLQGRIASVG